MKLARIATPAMFAALLGAAALSHPACRQPAQPPNILYIMTDDHAAHMLSCYGSKIASTPNLDRIASQGIRFENAFVTNSLCAPSRAVILTGRYSHKNGQRTNGDTFDGAQHTFPKLLQQAGYQTAMIGKWHLKSDPTGFDYWNILPGQGQYHNPQLIEMGETKTHQGYVTDIITDIALDWLKNRDQTRPFALLYHHKAPHGGWEPDEKHVSMFEGETIPAPETFGDDLTGRARPVQVVDSLMVPTLLERITRWRHPTKPVPDEKLPLEAKRQVVYQGYVKDYMRVVASVDDNVGRVLDYLDEAGLTDNTVVIYTSDNGMFVGDHGLFDKRLMHEVSLRLPLLVRYPARIKPGSVTKAFSLNADYAPTILDYAGVPIPSGMQGRSLRPVLEGATPADWRKSIYYHYYEEDVWELIDLQADPLEYKNVYDDPANAAIISELKAELDRLRAELEIDE